MHLFSLALLFFLAGCHRPETSYQATGRVRSQWGDGIPVPLNEAVLERGRAQFGTYCQSCHGAWGEGDGLMTRYRLAEVGPVATLQSPRLRAMADGELFDVIAHGRGKMMGYGKAIGVEDRWAIVAYVRALQTLSAEPPAFHPVDAPPPADPAAFHAQEEARLIHGDAHHLPIAEAMRRALAQLQAKSASPAQNDRDYRESPPLTHSAW